MNHYVRENVANNLKPLTAKVITIMAAKQFKYFEWVVQQLNFSNWTNLINSLENQKANI